MTCVFCRIVAGEIPAEVVAREPEVVAFLDTHPLADGHVLVVPRAHVALLEDLEPAAADALLRAAVRLALPGREALRAAATSIAMYKSDAAGAPLPHEPPPSVRVWSCAQSRAAL